MTIDQVSRSVGHRGDTAYRWLLTLYVLEQANRTGDAQWEEASKSFNFSFLYTAPGYRAVRDFLEIDNTQLRDPKEDPVPDKQHRRLLDHMSDLYGPAPGDPDRAKIRDSRTIRQLAAVYASDEAVESLRTGASLGEAYRRTAGEEMELIELLRDASVNLDRANGVAPHHKGQSQALRYASRCKESAEALVGLLEG